MNCVPSGVTNSRQGVFPPYLQVAGSTVGVEPRTPQKLNLAMGTVISLVAYLLFGIAPRSFARESLTSWWQRRYAPSIDSAQRVVKVPNKALAWAARPAASAYNGQDGPRLPCARRSLP